MAAEEEEIEYTEEEQAEMENERKLLESIMKRMNKQGQWYWKTNLEEDDSNPDAWEPYDQSLNLTIDRRYQGGMKTHTFSKTHKINFLRMVQEEVDDYTKTIPVKRVEPPLDDDEENEEDAEAKTKKRKTEDENNNNNNSQKPPVKKELRSGGKTKIHWLCNTPLAASVMSRGILWGNSLPISKIANQLDATHDFVYGDLVYFEPERGHGLFVVSVRDGEMILIKTLDESGYILPPEFRVGVPRSYYSEDGNITFGHTLEDEEKYYDEGAQDVEDEFQEEEENEE